MTRLVENLWVKIAAILLAVLLWFHVVTDKTYENKIHLPLMQVDLPPELVLAEPPTDSILVTVSATGKMLLRTNWKKRGMRLIVNRSYPGKFRVDITPENLSLVKAETVHLIDVISPREIMLACDVKLEKTVPVKSRITVMPDEGYAVGDDDSTVPGTVTVVGPRTQMTAVRYIQTEEKVLEGVRNDFTIKLALDYPEVYGLIIEPDSVVAHISTVPIKRRVFPDIAISLINPPRGRRYEIAPGLIELEVAGKAEAIDSLTPSRISALADYILADSNGMAPVHVVVPPAISLLYKSIDSVRIIEKQ
jgi:YbbR domain-containing protein